MSSSVLSQYQETHTLLTAGYLQHSLKAGLKPDTVSVQFHEV